MNSSKQQSKLDPVKEQGKAIARGISQENIRIERNKQIAEKRKESTLRNAAEKVFSQNY